MTKTTNLDSQTLVAMYRTMALIRHFEETMVNVYWEGKTPVFDIAAGTVPGEMHLAAGQEPVAVGSIGVAGRGCHRGARRQQGEPRVR